MDWMVWQIEIEIQVLKRNCPIWQDDNYSYTKRAFVFIGYKLADTNETLILLAEMISQFKTNRCHSL